MLTPDGLVVYATFFFDVFPPRRIPESRLFSMAAIIPPPFRIASSCARVAHPLVALRGLIQVEELDVARDHRIVRARSPVRAFRPRICWTCDRRR